MQRTGNKFVILNTITKVVIALSFSLAAQAKSKGDSGLKDLKFKAGEEKENDKKALGAELLIATQEEKAISQLHKLLKKYKNTQLEPDLMNRLGELHMRRAKTDRFLEMHRSQASDVSFAPKLVKSAASRKQIATAIGIFDSIEKKYPRYDRIDSVIFNNAFANQQIGNQKVAEAKFLKLLKEHPSSNLAPDAHLAIGEIQFHSRQFAKALQNFSAIRKYPDSIVYAYGLYKAAWTYYNMRDANAGLRELEDVVKYGRFVQEQNIDARLDLRKEALLDMALFFEDARPSKEAYKYFANQAGSLDVSPPIMRLADLYKRHSRHEDINVLLTEFVKNQPTSIYVPTAYLEMMAANDNLKRRGQVITLLENFYGICDAKSQWSKSQPQDAVSAKDSPLAQYNESLDAKPTAQAVCAKLVARLNLGYANKWLKIWQKDASQTDLANAAEKSFDLFLRYDSTSDESSRARFVYAELLFKRNKFREASAQYAVVGTQTKDPKTLHDSRYYSITSLEKAVKGKWSDDDENQFRKLSDLYLNKTKDPKYKLDVEFKLALILYEKAKYDESAPLFLKIGNVYAKEEKGIKSQDLYLDILNIKKDYKSLKDYSSSLRAKASGTRAVSLTKIYEESSFLLVQKLEEKGNFEDAIKGYRQFIAENPKSKLAQKAHWNSIQLYYKTNQLLLGAQSAMSYYSTYPDTKDGHNALTKAAQTYESIGELEEAAQALVELAKVDAANKTKWLMLAADYYTLSSNFNEATPIYLKLKGSAKTDFEFRALEQLEYISRVEGKKSVRESYLREISASGRQPQASLAADYFVQAAYEAGKLDDAFNLAKKVLAQEKSGASKIALANSRLVQARILDKEFRSQSLKARLDKLQIVLAAKTEKLGKAQVAYQSVIKFGHPKSAVTAYYELANSYLHYSEAVRGVPMPKDVPENEIQIFRDELEKLAIPMEEKGIETLMLAHKLAAQYNIYDGIMTQIAAQMKKYNQSTQSHNSLLQLKPAVTVLPKFEKVGS